MQKNKNKIIYLVSPRYSGSTLLSFVFGYFDEISTIGERKKFYVKTISPDTFEKRCSCGETFAECPKWNTIKKRYLQRVDNKSHKNDFTQFQLSRYSTIHRILSRVITFLIGKNLPLKPILRFLLKKTLFHNKELINTILELDNNQFFLDSSKFLNHVLYLSLIEEYDIKIIHVFRYAPAQISSAIKHNNWNIEYATNQWVSETLRNIQTFKKWKSNVYHLPYERFCNNYENELEKMFEFIGLNHIEFGEIDWRGKEQHIMGNTRMRLGSDFEIKERSEWKKQLTEDQFNFIVKKTNKIQEQLNFL